MTWIPPSRGQIRPVQIGAKGHGAPAFQGKIVVEMALDRLKGLFSKLAGAEIDADQPPAVTDGGKLAVVEVSGDEHKAAETE